MIARIGVITSGGDCGGLNAVIKGVGRMACSFGIKVFAIPRGYAGLYNLKDCESLTELTPERVDAITATLAGSEAGHSRIKISKINDSGKYERIKDGLKKHGLDALVIAGGDDTGSVAVDLSKHDIPCIHVPKTMDLDLQPYSVGGDSAIHRVAQFVTDLRTTAQSHNRTIVLEVFGRNAGHVALYGGIGGEADCILIPENAVDFDAVYAHFKNRFFWRIASSDVKAGTYLIVVAEGMVDKSGKEITDSSVGVDAFNHKKLSGAGQYVRKEIERRMKEDPEIAVLMKRCGLFVPGIYEAPEIRELQPGHLVRCGGSSPFDIDFGYKAGAAAVTLLCNNIRGVTIVKVSGNVIEYIDISEAIKSRPVDPVILPLYEQLGICFGRQPQGKWEPLCQKVSLPITRFY